MPQIFNNKELLQQAWYPLMPSRRLKKGCVKGFVLHKQKLALYRDGEGIVKAVYARCPHLGADLSLGKLKDGRLQCAFHGWEFGRDGKCEHIPNASRIPRFARTFSYPTAEKYGYIWVFNGPEPTYAIPDFSAYHNRSLRFNISSGKMKLHSHVCICNGLDIQHWKTLHGMEFIGDPKIVTDSATRLETHFQILPDGKSSLSKLIRKLLGKPIQMEYATIGGTTALAATSLLHTRLEVLFAHRPLADGSSTGRTFFRLRLAKGLRIIPQLLCLPLVLLVMGHVLRGDVQLFNTVDFRPGLIPEDDLLIRYIKKVNRMGSFHPEKPDLVVDEAILPIIEMQLKDEC